MIDLKVLRDDPERVRSSQRSRGDDPAPVDALLEADERRRAVVSRADALRGEQKSVSQSVKQATPESRPAVLEQARALAAHVKALEAEQAEAEAALRAAHLAVPNVVQGAPPGGEQDFVVVEQVGEVPAYDFPVRDHLDVGTVLRAIDTERGAKVSGARFAFLTGPGALRELALVNLAMARAVEAGFVPVIAPALVRPEAMEGTGFLGAHADEVYRLANDDLYLVGTSEVPLAAYHSGEVLEELPLRYAGFSSCFRREAGSHGKDTRGIIRVHQFDKVEMFSYVALEEAEADAGLRAAHLAVPNVVLDGVPPGGEQDFVVVEHVGEVPTYDFAVQDHLDLGTALGAIDTERGAKVSGSRFAFLTGWGALLELALVNLAVGAAVEAGFTPVIAPALVRPEAMEGTGFLGAHADEVYRLAADDLYLVGTSEVPLAAFHSGEVLTDLPARYAGFSSCFRREAGSHGKDTRGIIRVHQFDKVEMFSYVEPSQAEAEHARLLAYEKAFLSLLELPFRVIDVAAGDLGSSAARKYDCEAWLPSQERWLELTSTSNCTDFQARRLGIRSRGASGLAPVATLNGTLCAVGRTIAVLLEVHQRADGSVHVPEALRPYLAGRRELLPL